MKIKEYEITEYTAWLEETLIADLRRSNPESCVADDLEKCVKIINQLRRELGKSKGVTAKDVAGRLNAANLGEGLSASVDWEHGDTAKVSITKKQGGKQTEVAHIVIQGGRAFLPDDIKAKLGHGISRVRGDGATTSSFVERVENALRGNS